MPYQTLLALALAIAALLAWIWLAIRAAGKSLVWGSAVLLLPVPAALIYGSRYWYEERVAFLAWLGINASAAALALFLFSNWNGWELLRVQSRVSHGLVSQQLSVADAETYLNAGQAFSVKSGLDVRNPSLVRQASAFIDQEKARQSILQEATKQQSKQDNLSAERINQKVATLPVEHSRLVYRTIPVQEARNYIGATVKVTRHNVEEKEYRLTGVTDKSLQFAQRNSNGAYSFAFRIADIEKLRVLVRE